MSASAPPRGHDIYEALAVALAIDSLEPADQAIFEEHRGGCVRCARTVLLTLEVATELAYGVPDIDPPPQLRRRILAAATPRPPIRATSLDGVPEHRGHDEDDLGGPAGFAALDLFGDGTPADRAASDGPETAPRTQGGGPRSPGHRRPSGPPLGLRTAVRTGSRRRRIVSVLAAAALVGISAVTTWEVTRPAAVTAPVAAPERTATLSPPAGQGTVATVVVRGGTADVVTDVLAPNAEDRQFYLWGVPARGTGTPQVVGTFTVTTSGLHSYPVQLTRSLEGYPVLAISEEAAGSTPASPSGVLARGALSR
ncbi:MAG TPA: anti-sigma factor [Mycobacteriales bacterium]